MATEMLRQIARSRLPATVYGQSQIRQVRQLCKAGLVIALAPGPDEVPADHATAAQVLAITQEGRAQLAKFTLPACQPKEAPSQVLASRIGGWLGAWRQGAVPG